MNPFVLRIVSLLLAFAITRPSRAEPSGDQEVHGELPPVDLAPHRSQRYQPSVNGALLLSVCGVGQSAVFERARFCAGAQGDVLWGRTKYDKAGAGLALGVGTAGFRDFRSHVSGVGLLPLGSFLTLGFSLGPLLRVERGLAAGVRSSVELGHRMVSPTSHYALSHALFVGFEWTAGGADPSPQNVILLGVRVDGIWLTAPAMLFR